MFFASRQMRFKTTECFLFLTQFPVCVASVIESDHDSVSVGCGLVTMTLQSSFWKAHDSGQRPTVTVQLFAVVKHLNSGSRRLRQKKKKKVFRLTREITVANVEQRHPRPRRIWEIR